MKSPQHRGLFVERILMVRFPFRSHNSIGVVSSYTTHKFGYDTLQAR